MVKLHPRHKFLEKAIKNFKHPDAQHTVICGDSAGGKGYLSAWFFELGILLGYIKLYNLWINKWSHLREAMTFMYPSKELQLQIEYDKLRICPPLRKAIKVFCPEKIPFLKTKVWSKASEKYLWKTELPSIFKLRIYVPISQGLPKELPLCSKKPEAGIGSGLIVPFTVSVDNFSKIAIQCLTGYQDAQQIYAEYIKVKKKGINFTQLKKALHTETRQDMKIEKAYAKKRWISYHRSNISTVAGLSGKLALLNREGVVADQKYKYALERLLPLEVQDPETIVLLYTGFVPNEDLQKLIMIYFTDVLQQTLQKYTAKPNSKYYKSVLFLPEWETLCKNVKGDTTSGVIDGAVNEFIKKTVSTIRHVWGELFLDVKGLESIDPSVREKLVNRYMTRLRGIKEIELLTKGLNTIHKPSQLLTISKRWVARGFYRFVDIFEEIPTWKPKGTTEEGSSLPRKRLCKDGHIQMEINSFRYIEGEDMRKYYNFVKTAELIEDHALYLNIPEEKLIKQEEEKKAQQRSEKKLSQQKHDTRLKRIKLMQKLKHDNLDIKKVELQRQLGVSVQQIYMDEQFLKGKPEYQLPKEILNIPIELFRAKLNQGKI